MHSRVLVQDATVRDGRDGVYTHRADGTVVRNSSFESMRFGVHEMYTSDSLLANNTMRETTTGIIVMTRPSGNVMVGNDVRDSDAGISTAGSATIATGNVLVDNGRGLSIGSTRSTFARNTIAYNGVGIREETLLPTSDVFGNDVVGNDDYVDTGRGVMLLWADGDRGNYWGTVPGVDRDGDGVVDRSFRPTGPLDTAAARGGGAALLAESPAIGAARAFQRAVPGLRPSGVVDPAPLSDPVRPDRLDQIRATHQ
jgi:nitrous oxidase accessory protein NosD